VSILAARSPAHGDDSPSIGFPWHAGMMMCRPAVFRFLPTAAEQHAGRATVERTSFSGLPILSMVGVEERVVALGARRLGAFCAVAPISFRKRSAGSPGPPRRPVVTHPSRADTTPGRDPPPSRGILPAGLALRSHAGVIASRRLRAAGCAGRACDHREFRIDSGAFSPPRPIIRSSHHAESRGLMLSASRAIHAAHLRGITMSVKSRSSLARR